MLRIILALLASVAVNCLIVMAAETTLIHVLPVHRGVQSADQFMASVPVAAMVFLIASWAVAVLAACLVAVRIAPSLRWMSWAAAALPLLGAISNFVTIHHPLWMVLAGSASPFIAAYTTQPRTPERDSFW